MQFLSIITIMAAFTATQAYAWHKSSCGVPGMPCARDVATEQCEVPTGACPIVNSFLNELDSKLNKN